MRRLQLIAVFGALAGNSVNAGDSLDEVALARKVLGHLQVRSALENMEYCGYIGHDRDGTLRVTEAVPGGPDWCEADWPDGWDVIASYHTHAAYDPNAWSEFPSGEDMEMDEAEGIDGFVGTPGGRLWYIDSSEMIASQICGIGCLPRGPRFRPAPEDDIRDSYPYDDLIEKTETD